MIGIYKITNLINNKSYIGQSTNIKKRWTNHKSTANNRYDHAYNYPLYRAFRKYGIENFSFEVLEECSIEELNQKEIYWISKYDTYEKGYNQVDGGNNTLGKLTNNNLLDLITIDLKEDCLSMCEIASKYSLSYEMIQGINTGRHWVRDIDYPIRKTKEKETYYCIDCGKEVTNGSTRCIDCFHKTYGCKKHPEEEELLELIKKYSMVQIGKMYEVSDNAVRRWCKKYGLPYKRDDIKKLLD